MTATTKVRFINEQRTTRIEDGYCDGWKEFCNGHETLDQAIMCKEKHMNDSKAFAAANPKYKADFAGLKVEIRVNKVTVIQEIVEQPEEFKV